MKYHYKVYLAGKLIRELWFAHPRRLADVKAELVAEGLPAEIVIVRVA